MDAECGHVSSQITGHGPPRKTDGHVPTAWPACNMPFQQQLWSFRKHRAEPHIPIPSSPTHGRGLLQIPFKSATHPHFFSDIPSAQPAVLVHQSVADLPVHDSSHATSDLALKAHLDHRFVTLFLDLGGVGHAQGLGVCHAQAALVGHQQPWPVRHHGAGGLKLLRDHRSMVRSLRGLNLKNLKNDGVAFLFFLV